MRISQNTGFLVDILRDAGEGKLVPAAFQRPYVWSRDDVLAFWKSLLRRWPTGSMLIWEPGSSVDMSRVGRTRLGPIVAEGRATGLILDGQNRLASFAWSLRQPGDPMPDVKDLSLGEMSTWGGGDILVLDPDIKGVRFAVPDELYGDQFLLPAGYILDYSKFWPFMRERMKNGGFPEATQDASIKWFEEAGAALREARCATVVLERATRDEALEAFRHIAKTGVPMSERDFEAAMAWTFDEEGPKP